MILNLTQHAATPEQMAAGVVDVTDEGQRAEMLACGRQELSEIKPFFSMKKE